MNFDSIARQFGDRYDRNARLYPALLACLPFIVTVVALYGNSLGVLGSTISSIVLSFGGLFLLSDVARNRGKLAEKKLWEKWGGPPSTEVMRHANTTIDPHTKARCHQFLSAQLGAPLPDAQTEAADPAAADLNYHSAGRWLVSHTADGKKFPLLKNDNITYGFRRNSYALRHLGMLVAIASLTWTCLHKGVANLTARLVTGPVEDWFSTGEWLAAAVSVAMLCIWFWYFTEEMVQAAGRSYAEKLMLACETMAKSSRSRSSARAKNDDAITASSTVNALREEAETRNAPKKRARKSKQANATNETAM
ncbi:hypothetical protein [Burkholderia multivorans]|uniref:hypothetical protein n=1 Tax=Burkholderia multivorans TaxID=87883 RepID=UPI000A8ABF1E|nr:hypothetical protein [Burkholderia multivorans]